MTKANLKAVETEANPLTEALVNANSARSVRRQGSRLAAEFLHGRRDIKS